MKRTPAIFIRAQVSHSPVRFKKISVSEAKVMSKEHSVTKNTEEKTQNLPGFGVNRLPGPLTFNNNYWPTE